MLVLTAEGERGNFPNNQSFPPIRKRGIHSNGCFGSTIIPNTGTLDINVIGSESRTRAQAVAYRVDYVVAVTNPGGNSMP